MKEKLLMISFMSGGLADIGTTMIGLRMGLTEVNPLMKNFLNEGYQGEIFAYGTKLFVYSLIILGFAITKSRESNFSYAFEKSIEIGNVLTFALIGSNILQILAESIH